MERNRRKLQTLEIFTRWPELRPGDYAVEARFYPIRAAWSYLRKLQRMNLLNRRRDFRGRLVYRLSKRGAAYLLWVRRGRKVLGS